MGAYTRIFDQNRIQLDKAAKLSRSWYQRQVLSLARQHIRPLALIRSEPHRNVTHIVPGELYLFRYYPKHEDKLPYWDMFPLVFPFRRTTTGFVGINLHYLPYQQRAILFENLMRLRTNKAMNDHTRLKASWATIQMAAKHRFVQACVHQYLADHISSSVKRIDAADWQTAMLLPVETFVGASKQQVWREALHA